MVARVPAGLVQHGVPVASADRVVGTSAGSVVATVVTAGHLAARTRGGSAGQGAGGCRRARALRRSASEPGSALDRFWSADSARPDTIRAIGHAALAAQTPEVDTLPRSLELVLGQRHWTSDALWITATDAYTRRTHPVGV